MAALGREGRVSGGALYPTCLLHFSKPQSPASSSPAKADRNLPRYLHCHRSCRHAVGAVNSKGAPLGNRAFSQSQVVWASRYLFSISARGVRCISVNFPLSFPTGPTLLSPNLNSLLTGLFFCFCFFLQKLTPMAGDFYLGQTKFNSVISLTFCRLLHSIVH